MWPYVHGIKVITSFSITIGPMFFLSCFSVAAGLAVLYYYGGESYKVVQNRGAGVKSRILVDVDARSDQTIQMNVTM